MMMVLRKIMMMMMVFKKIWWWWWCWGRLWWWWVAWWWIYSTAISCRPCCRRWDLFPNFLRTCQPMIYEPAMMMMMMMMMMMILNGLYHKSNILLWVEFPVDGFPYYAVINSPPLPLHDKLSLVVPFCSPAILSPKHQKMTINIPPAASEANCCFLHSFTKSHGRKPFLSIISSSPQIDSPSKPMLIHLEKTLTSCASLIVKKMPKRSQQEYLRPRSSRNEEIHPISTKNIYLI